MSDDGFKVQWSVSLPPAAQYAKGDMLNIRGGSAAEVEEQFDEILRDQFIDKAVEVAAFLRKAAIVTEGGVPQNADSGSTATTTTTQTTTATGHTCPHGARVRREGDGRTGHWVGWFCQLPKGDANQCKPDFEDNN